MSKTSNKFFGLFLVYFWFLDTIISNQRSLGSISIFTILILRFQIFQPLCSSLPFSYYDNIQKTFLKEQNEKDSLWLTWYVNLILPYNSHISNAPVLPSDTLDALGIAKKQKTNLIQFKKAASTKTALQVQFLCLQNVLISPNAHLEASVQLPELH